MKQRRKFSSEQKAQIVLSILKKEISPIDASKKHSIAPNLINKWKEEFLEKSLTIFETKNDETAKDKKIKQYEYIISKITTQNDFLEKVLAVTK